jgi:hypothetical protein
VALLLAFPNLALSVRRLHDADMSGWWVLLCPFLVGYILLALAGSPGPNRFGPLPGASPHLPPLGYGHDPGFFGGPPPQGFYGDPPPQGSYGGPPPLGSYGGPPPQGPYGGPSPQGPYGGPPSRDPVGAPPRPGPSAGADPGERGTPDPVQDDEPRPPTVPLDKD